MLDSDQTKPDPCEFDFSAFPEDTLFYDRRTGRDRRDHAGPRGGRGRATQGEPKPPAERRARKERRRRIDPTTFEKQYTDDEVEFMNAMQRFKDQSCKSFPSHGDVLRVALALGYRRLVPVVDDDAADPDEALGAVAADDETADPSPYTIET